MSIKHLYADERPSLLLDFANSKTLDPRITFERLSAGTYVDAAGIIKTAADNEARFDHDPVTGECRGLLIEEERTNLVEDSKCTDTSYWSLTTGNPQTATVGSSTEPAPNGVNEALLLNNIIGGSGTGHCYFNKNYTFLSAGDYVISCYVKYDTTAGNDSDNSYIGLVNFTNSVPAGTVKFVWDTLDWDITSKANYGDRLFPPEYFGNGWYRISVRCTIDAADLSGAFRFGIGNLDNGFSNRVTRLNYNGGLFWGIQVEEGSFHTSHIPTSGSTYQRKDDEASITGTNFSSWYNQSKGSWFVEAKCPVSPNNQWIFALNPSGTGEDMLYRGSTNALRSLARYRGDVFDTNDAPSGQFNKAILGYNLTSQASSYFNAVSGIYSSISGNTGTPTSLAFGLTPGNSVLNGHISRLAYYNTRLSNTALEALTK